MDIAGIICGIAALCILAYQWGRDGADLGGRS